MDLSFAIILFILWRLFGEHLVKKVFEKDISKSENYCFRKILIWQVENLNDRIIYNLFPVYLLFYIFNVIGINNITGLSTIVDNVEFINAIFNKSTSINFGKLLFFSLITCIVAGFLKIGFVKKNISCLQDISCNTLK